MSTKPAAEILYNETCPVCAAEIAHYRAHAEARALPLAFLPLSEAARFGLSEEAAARRLHVLKEGRLLSGVPAFIALWEEMPRYRPLARIVGLPGVRHFAALVYDFILAPALYAAHRRRQRRSQGRAIRPPEMGAAQPVVEGAEVGRPRETRTASQAKA